MSGRDGVASIRIRSILCVDDDPQMRELLDQASPARVVFAPTAFEALRALHHDLFDAYVLNYWLRDWSGVQMCRTIRGNDAHGPVFFCSAAGRELDRRRALRAGATIYLCKPVDGHELRERLHVALTAADVDSLGAKPYAEEALQAEVERCASRLLELLRPGQLSAVAIDRAARPNVYKVFVAHRGTRANFERWWPQMLAAAIANHAVLHGGPLAGAVARGAGSFAATGLVTLTGPSSSAAQERSRRRGVT